MLFKLATDSWVESGKMSVKRYRPSCDISDQQGLVISGGLHSYVDTIEYTTDGAAFDHLMNETANDSNNMLRYATPDSNYLHCMVALDNGNLVRNSIHSEKVTKIIMNLMSRKYNKKSRNLEKTVV